MEPSPRRVQSLDYHTPAAGARSRRRTLLLAMGLTGGAILLAALAMGFYSFTEQRSVPAPLSSPLSGNLTATPSGASSGASKLGDRSTATASGFAENLLEVNHPQAREAVAATTDILDRLLAGKLDEDPNLSPVARKVKGYRTWSITTAASVAGEPPAWNFGGTLDGGARGSARFSVRMVRQRNGGWAVGSFSGPNAP